MISLKHTHESGQVNGWLIATISLAILSIGAIAGAVWGYLSYAEQKTNVDNKVGIAVVTAKKEQADIDEAKIVQYENALTRQFVGPDDYGRLTFNYPRIWSTFINRDVTQGGTFEAYLNPDTVPPVSLSQQYALRVTIEQKSYDTVIASYAPLIKKGTLRSSAVSVDGNNGTRIDGSFSKDIRGSAVIYKIRDKTVTLRTDADTFKPSFDALIQTIKFNQ